jgi:hypothetical protein
MYVNIVVQLDLVYVQTSLFSVNCNQNFVLYENDALFEILRIKTHNGMIVSTVPFRLQETYSSSGLPSALLDAKHSITLSSVPPQNIFIGIGHYEGHVIAVKNIRKNYMYLTDDVIREMNEVYQCCMKDKTKRGWVTGI